MIGRIDSFRGSYRWLSNFYIRPTIIEGVEFSSTEHYFQWAKAASEAAALQAMSKVNSPEIYSSLAKAHSDFNKLTPKRAKYFGHIVTLNPVWKEYRNIYMATANFAKYWQHSDLRQRLLDTGTASLIEGNTWHDYYWGHCTCGSCPTGQNVLGQILMATRSYFQGVRNVL